MNQRQGWIESLFENPNTSIMGLTQMAMAIVISWELYKGTISMGTGLPLAATSFAGGIGNLLAGDAARRWAGRNYSKEPAGDCEDCLYKFQTDGVLGCDRRGHLVSERDTCDEWKPLNEIHKNS